VWPNSTKQRPKEQFRKNRKRSDCLGLKPGRKTGLSLKTNNLRTSKGRRFDETTSDVRMVDMRENDAMLHSVKTKGDVMIVSVLKRGVAMIVVVRKTNNAPITTEGCTATKNKRSH
jgi:hypothetical protein